LRSLKNIAAKLGDSVMNSASVEKSRRLARPLPNGKPSRQMPELTNIMKTAIRIIAGSEPGEVARAARFIEVSEPTLYRWRRAGNMLEARGAEVLRVHELTGLPVELLLRG
jgi:hypothetical protein